MLAFSSVVFLIKLYNIIVLRRQRLKKTGVHGRTMVSLQLGLVTSLLPSI